MNSDQPLPSTSGTVGNSDAMEEDIKRAFNKLSKARETDALDGPSDASEEVLQRKLTAKQHEERALLSLISRLRSHQRTLQLEKVRLDQFYEESIKKEMFGTVDDRIEGL